MKGTFTAALAIIFSLLVIPLAALSKADDITVPTQTLQSDVPYVKDKNSIDKIKVLFEDTVTEYSIDDYVFGVVAAEMPALYHEEALKAQAVAAYTFALYSINNNKSTKYDISSDPNTAQSFITRRQATEKWGEKATEYTKKIDDCIAAAKGQILVYDDKPIFAAYHAISPGRTNTCLDVWGKDLPYLKSVDSFGDKLANGYLSEVTFTAEEIAEKLKTVSNAVGEAQNYFTDFSTSENGYVKSINYCGKKVNGSQISKLLGLRSSNFELGFSDNVFTFKVTGYGHGVGLSQTGADYMANQGSTYEEILLHYYKDAVLQK